MSQPTIRFDDGAAYERGMAGWSRIAGDVFLDWLAPAPGQRWVDVGCGNGAFTELLVQRCAPAETQGIDPSDEQISYACTRPGARGAQFQIGDAMALPFADDRFDAASMALVIFFVPEPAKGVAEMARVVRPGGVVAAYAWDMLGGGFPWEPVQAELRALGLKPPLPPSVAAANMDNLRALWNNAGLRDVQMREIAVRRTYADFEAFWISCTGSGSLTSIMGTLSSDDAAKLKERVRAKMPTDGQGRVTYGARANAVKGVVD